MKESVVSAKWKPIKLAREYLGALVWDREYLVALAWDKTARAAHWLADYADQRRFGGEFDVCDCSNGVDPLVDMLRRALGNRTGKIRADDAFILGAIDPAEASLNQIERFGRAIRALGWKRTRKNFDGFRGYAYVKGSAEQRKTELVVEYDPRMRMVRVETATNERERSHV